MVALAVDTVAIGSQEFATFGGPTPTDGFPEGTNQLLFKFFARDDTGRMYLRSKGSKIHAQCLESTKSTSLYGKAVCQEGQAGWDLLHPMWKDKM